MGSMKTLTLVKEVHVYYFRYEAGQETLVLDALVELVNNREHNFDWFDASVLSHQIQQDLERELKSYLPKKAC